MVRLVLLSWSLLTVLSQTDAGEYIHRDNGTPTINLLKTGEISDGLEFDNDVKESARPRR